MEQITREQMIAEFGEPGVENASVVDLIDVDAVPGQVVLAMFERRDWGSDPRQFTQIEEKINRYMGYVLDGFLVEHYPQHAGKPVSIRLDCAQQPQGEALKFVRAAEHAIRGHDLGFILNVTAGAT